MKSFFGSSRWTTVLGYMIAAMTAVFPLMSESINWDSRHDVFRYAGKLLLAAAIAVFGRKAADSTQVKEVKKQADVNTAMIDMHIEKKQEGEV